MGAEEETKEGTRIVFSALANLPSYEKDTFRNVRDGLKNRRTVSDE